MNSGKLSGRERFSGNTVLNPLFNHKSRDLSLDSSHLILTSNSDEDLSKESCHPVLLGTQQEKDRPPDGSAKFILETPFSCEIEY